MPKPFPFPLQIGTDICSIPRILRLLRNTNSSLPQRFIKRILTPTEISQSKSRLGDRVEAWRDASRGRVEIGWRMKEMGLKAKDLEEGRLKRTMGKLGTQWAKDMQRRERAGPKGVSYGVTRESRKSLGEGIEGGALGNQVDVGIQGGRADVSVSGQLSLGKAKGEEEDPRSVQERLNEVDQLVKLVTENDKEVVAAEAGLVKAAEFMAGRFAAKEAAIKAHHNRKLTYQSIAIHRAPDTKDGSQPPVAVILPENGTWEEGQEVKVSISHDGEYATAVCLAFDTSSNFAPDGTLTGKKGVSKKEKSGGLGRISEKRHDIFAPLDQETAG